MLADNKLETMMQKWQAMPRNNPAELEEADAYFDDMMMPIARELFLKKEAGKHGKYDSMVLTLGTSWQPLALSIAAMQPKEVLLLSTDNTLKFAKQVEVFAAVPETKFTFVTVSRSDAAGIYMVCDQWGELMTKGSRVCVDITGGTKAMVSALAMYAARNRWDVYYVESKYLPLYRRAEPGSEELVLLPLP